MTFNAPEIAELGWGKKSVSLKERKLINKDEMNILLEEFAFTLIALPMASSVFMLSAFSQLEINSFFSLSPVARFRDQKWLSRSRSLSFSGRNKSNYTCGRTER